MNEFDIFKLACELGFDVIGAELKDSTNSLILVDETIDKIPYFDSNKVIAYNCKKDISTKVNSVAKHLLHYVQNKENSKKLYFAERNIDVVNIEESKGLVDINNLVNLCIQKGLVSDRKKTLKKLYKNSI